MSFPMAVNTSRNRRQYSTLLMLSLAFSSCTWVILQEERCKCLLSSLRVLPYETPVFHANLRTLILSLIRVTIDGVWIGNSFYWTLLHTTLDYTLQITITHRLVFSLTVFTALLGNVFQQWTFLCFRTHPRRLAAISHQPPTLLTAVSGLLVMAACPPYIGSAWTAQKTPLPLLRVLALPGKQRAPRAVP
jgi:hypothetical protein